MDLVWEQPPEDALNKPRQGPYTDVIVALKKNPQQWARIPREFKNEESATNAAANMRRGIGSFAPRGSFEAVAQGAVVWARYMGATAPADADDDEADGDGEPKGDPGIAPKIRAWAKGQGLEVAAHGRLPKDIVDAYFDDTGEERPAQLRVVNGG